jgi:hydroxyethylthiazole kinase-like sugar kinase family protein
MNYTANALLAMGAPPVMAYAHNEVEEMINALYSIGPEQLKDGCKIQES